MPIIGIFNDATTPIDDPGALEHPDGILSVSNITGFSVDGEPNHFLTFRLVLKKTDMRFLIPVADARELSDHLLSEIDLAVFGDDADEVASDADGVVQGPWPDPA